MSLSFNSQLDFDNFKRGYSIAIFSIWGLGIQIPRLLIRYGKAYPMVINIHSIMMLMLGLFTIMYVIGQIAMNISKYGSSYKGLEGLELAQFIMSIILSCLVLIQFILGFLARVEMFKNKLSSSLFTVKRSHKIVGNITVIFGKVVATFVVKNTVSQLIFKGWLFCLAGIAILYIFVEAIYRSQSKTIILNTFFKHKNRLLKYHNQIYQKILDKKDSFRKYEEKGIRYVIIDNGMYYIDENFMHPGGQYIFSLLNGKEINYYLKGAKSISPEFPRHLHTKYVTKYLQNRFIGELSVEPLLINQKLPNDNADWKIVTNLATNYIDSYLIMFQTDSGYVREAFKVENFGKYVMIGCSSEEILNKTQRPYYLCHSIGDYQISILDKFRKYYKYYYYNEIIDQSQQKRHNIESISKKLSLFIKQYKRGLFTQYLLNAPKERIFNLNGPYGKGLGLKQKSSGYYVLIAGGIGIVAFVDLFTYLLQKTLYDLIKIKASSPSLKKINQDNVAYEFLSDIKILLVGTFTNPEKFYLSTTIKQLYYLNIKHNLKNFNMMIRYQNGENEQEVKMLRENFNTQFFKNLFEEEVPDHVIFSGSGHLQSLLRHSQTQLKLKNPIYYL